jgi:hypothetical protein
MLRNEPVGYYSPASLFFSEITNTTLIGLNGVAGSRSEGIVDFLVSVPGPYACRMIVSPQRRARLLEYDSTGLTKHTALRLLHETPLKSI